VSEGTTVVIGAYNIDNPSAGTEYIPVAEWIAHPEYNPDTYDNDVSLIRLEWAASSTNFAYPIFTFNSSFIEQLMTPGVSSTVVGWGATSEGGSGSSVLLEVDVPIVSHSDCAESYGSEVHEFSMVCAGVIEGGIDSCQGDSGGPLVSTAYPYIQLGIVSWGYGCAAQYYYGIYTRLSNYGSFVYQYVQDLPSGGYSPTPTPTPCEGLDCLTDENALMSIRTNSGEDEAIGVFHKVMLHGMYTVKIESEGCTTSYQPIYASYNYYNPNNPNGGYYKKGEDNKKDNKYVNPSPWYTFALNCGCGCETIIPLKVMSRALGQSSATLQACF
jgi:secreted trypsin-like serine protease